MTLATARCPESGVACPPSPGAAFHLARAAFISCLRPVPEAISRFYPPLRNLPVSCFGHLACPARIRFRRAGPSFEGSAAPGRKNVDAIYITAFAVMAGLTFGLLQFCASLSSGEPS
ncbi:Uncharacterised protein [Achromobacter spanius]|nr:Uncharacterised protein [Achromobacter spanius]